MVWTDSLSVGVKKFDKAHQRLVEYINVLFAIIGYQPIPTIPTHVLLLTIVITLTFCTTRTQEKDKRKQQITSLLQCLIDYTQYHFAQEEELFTQLNYPDEAGHVRKHKHVFSNLSCTRVANMIADMAPPSPGGCSSR
jgi:hemerythrin